MHSFCQTSWSYLCTAQSTTFLVLFYIFIVHECTLLVRFIMNDGGRCKVRLLACYCLAFKANKHFIIKHIHIFMIDQIVGGGRGRGSVRDEKWTQSNQRRCQNKRSHRSKNNEKGTQQDRKSIRNLVQHDSKLSNDSFWWTIRPTLDSLFLELYGI